MILFGDLIENGEGILKQKEGVRLDEEKENNGEVERKVSVFGKKCEKCLQTGEGMVRLSCAHRFHGECLGKQRIMECPMCNSSRIY